MLQSREGIVLCDPTKKQHYKFGGYCFRPVSIFQYLDSTVSKELDIKEKIRKQIAAGIMAHYALNKILQSRLVGQSTKFRLYKNLIRPVVPYGAETWTLSRAAYRFKTEFNIYSELFYSKTHLYLYNKTN